MSDVLQRALAAHRAGRWDEAEALYRRILSQAPQDTQTLHLLGQLAHQRGQAAQAAGQLSAAVAWLRQAIQLNPQASDPYNDLAAALYACDRLEEAIAVCRKAQQRWPNDLRFLNNLGFLLQHRGDTAEAVAAYRATLRLYPDNAEGHVNLGLALIELGDLEEGHTALETALRINPRNPEALGMLASNLRDRLPEAHALTAQEVLADPAITPERKAGLCYGLAHFHDARQEIARAAQLLRQANGYYEAEARQRGRPYDPTSHRADVEQIIAAYNPAYFERVRGWGSDSELPVFIVGLPRSGTTLAEQILASHPQVFGAGELRLIGECYRRLPELVRRYAPPVACVADLTAPQVQQLARHYLDQLRAHHPSAPHIVDKMPMNYLQLGLIATLLPRARLIHIRRDLCDVALSIWMTYLPNLRWSFHPDHIRERIREHVRLMERWRRVLPLPLLEIDYEDLVNDTEAVARRMVAWCGLEWDPACLAFHQTRRVVRTASKMQVREPVYRRSLGRWKAYEAFLGPLFAGMGDLVPGPPAEEKGKHV
jgi:tetratricopeptide (TPR) repeat protein